MKGKLLINQSYNTIVLDSIVLKPNTQVIPIKPEICPAASAGHISQACW